MGCNEIAVSALEQRSPTFPAPGAGFVEDNFSMDGAGRWVKRNASNGERAAGEASLTHPLLTSCCVDQGLGPLL